MFMIGGSGGKCKWNSEGEIGFIDVQENLW